MRPARTEPWQAMVAATWSSFSRRLTGPPSSAISAARSASSPATSVLPSAAGTDRTSIEVDDLGKQQRLPRHLAALASRAHPFENKALVGGVLVDDDETVLGLGDDVGRGDLASRDSEREAGHGLDG